MTHYIQYILKQLLAKSGSSKIVTPKNTPDGLEAFMARVKINSRRLR
ncbi:hypothetical protein [Dyadobacter frigoris]|nr:hypothetical protein [Dyadobacter frigoris]